MPLRIYFKNQFSRKTKQLSVQIKCSKQHWMLQKCIFLQFAIAQCGSKMSYSPAHEFSKHRASKSGQPTLKGCISLTLAIQCATVCYSDNMDTITLIFCEGNPDANLFTKN